MSDENSKLFTVELTEDEIGQCTHALNEWYDRLLESGHTSDMTSMKGFLNTIRKLESLVSSVIKTYLVYNPDDNLYKIGKSKNPRESISLMRHILGSNLEILYVVNEDLESDLRKRFSIQHHASDWFTDDGGSMQAYFKTKSMEIKEEPTDRFAMGMPSVDHAGEDDNKDDNKDDEHAVDMEGSVECDVEYIRKLEKSADIDSSALGMVKSFIVDKHPELLDGLIEFVINEVSEYGQNPDACDYAARAIDDITTWPDVNQEQADKLDDAESRLLHMKITLEDGGV